MGSVIMPVWVKSKTDEGVEVLLGSQPPAHAKPVFISHAKIESLTESEVSANGMTFAVLVLKKEESRP